MRILLDLFSSSWELFLRASPNVLAAKELAADLRDHLIQDIRFRIISHEERYKEI